MSCSAVHEFVASDYRSHEHGKCTEGIRGSGNPLSNGRSEQREDHWPTRAIPCETWRPLFECAFRFGPENIGGTDVAQGPRRTRRVTKGKSGQALELWLGGCFGGGAARDLRSWRRLFLGERSHRSNTVEGQQLRAVGCVLAGLGEPTGIPAARTLIYCPTDFSLSLTARQKPDR